MTDAQQKLHDAISDMDKFAAHNIGPTTSTTGFEMMLLKTAAAASELRGALRSNKNIESSVDSFEAAFNAMTAMSGSVMHSTKVANVSDEEIDEMHALLDAVRDEIKE